MLQIVKKMVATVGDAIIMEENLINKGVGLPFKVKEWLWEETERDII